VNEDPYTAGHTQGYADRQGGYEYQPEEDDPDYLEGYADGYDEADEDDEGE
jgi:hypothetical protein